MGDLSAKRLICVGGPLDGEMRAILYGARFTAPIPEELPRAYFWGEDDSNVGVTVEQCHYRREIIGTPEGDISFWVPEGQTALQTMELLLQTYHQAQGSK